MQTPCMQLSSIPNRLWALPDLIRYQAMIDRDFATAEKTLQECKDGEDKTYLLGYAALGRGDVTTAHRLFETLRPVFEARVRDHPEDSEQRSELGLLYAYLGRKEDAIRECRRAVDLGPGEQRRGRGSHTRQ